MLPPEWVRALSVVQWMWTFLFLGPSAVLLMVALLCSRLWLLAVLYYGWWLWDWHGPERGGTHSPTAPPPQLPVGRPSARHRLHWDLWGLRQRGPGGLGGRGGSGGPALALSPPWRCWGGSSVCPCTVNTPWLPGCAPCPGPACRGCCHSPVRRCSSSWGGGGGVGPRGPRMPPRHPEGAVRLRADGAALRDPPGARLCVRGAAGAAPHLLP
eukprot:XP_025011345.1 uncharacterized protein LOC112533497 isoform X1 [Gallus gallus]